MFPFFHKEFRKPKQKNYTVATSVDADVEMSMQRLSDNRKITANRKKLESQKSTVDKKAKYEPQRKFVIGQESTQFHKAELTM